MPEPAAATARHRDIRAHDSVWDRLSPTCGACSRAHTIDEIKPLPADRLGEEFLPQSVPSYAHTREFRQVRQTHPEYWYEEATPNPTNSGNRSTEWETDISQWFRNDAALAEFVPGQLPLSAKVAGGSGTPASSPGPDRLLAFPWSGANAPGRRWSAPGTGLQRWPRLRSSALPGRRSAFESATEETTIDG